MKKKIFIVIVILALLVVAYNVKVKQDKKAVIENVDKQIQELFDPTIKNTTFIIDEDKYILVMNGAKLNSSIIDGEKVNYFKELRGNAIIDFSVYKNEIEDENLIGSANYKANVKRDALESEFYIDTDEKSSIFSLISSFSEVYYDYIYSFKEADHNDSNSFISYDDGDIKYDNHGKPINEGYIEYYQEISSKGLDLVFNTVFKMEPNKEKLDINISVTNLQEEIEESYMTKESFDFKGEKITLYYHEEKNHNTMACNYGPMIMKKSGKLKLINLSSTSLPAISPDNGSIAYIAPFEWEAIGELYIYDIEDEYVKEIIMKEDIEDQNSIKVAKWLDDRYILTVIGFGYGTVSVGGDIYLYDTENKKLELVIKADSLDKELPRNRIEIMDFDIVDDNIIIKVAKHDEEFMEYTVEEKIIGKNEIQQIK